MIYFSRANYIELFLVCTFSTFQFLVFTDGRFLFLSELDIFDVKDLGSILQTQGKIFQ